jgi:3-dehydroquinate synthase
MNKVDSVFSGRAGWEQLQAFITGYLNTGIFILVDENTGNHCLPILLGECPELGKAGIISIKSSESNKTIAGIESIWHKLMQGNAVRNSLLICLGGGVVTDMGGFAAATYKRGMDFIHIPTTLLAMVDAAIGGKTGVNLDSVKNQVGVFALPKAVFIFDQFLKTLPKRQKLSGYAEMIKHSMTNSEVHFEKLILSNSPEKVCNEKSILESISVKTNIVVLDPDEKGRRKVLNFGHTIGHALETFSQRHDSNPLLLGEAIAIGMICESFISMRLLGFSEDSLKKMSSLVNWHFPHYRLSHGAANELFSIMYQDKKNLDQIQLNFTLLRKIGEPVWDQLVSEKLVRESLHFYTNLEIGFFV